jgi:phosphate:Na+ symporter
MMIVFCNRIDEVAGAKGKLKNFDEVTNLYRDIQNGYTQSLQELYTEAMVKRVNQSELSTLINFNREMYTAYKPLVFSVKDYVLDAKEAERFDELPGFIR